MADPWHRRLRPARVAGKVRREWMGVVERVRDRLETMEDARLLEVARGGRDVCWTDEGVEEPLVTVRIATYDRGQLLVERALASAVAQTYEHLEILVVGDGAPDEVEQLVRSVGDPRIRYVNLGARGIYPEAVRPRRLVAGSWPMNAALALARGSWIAPCDDDDEMTPDHVEVLLDHARRHRLEMVYSRARTELMPGEWVEIGREPLERGQIAHGAVLYTAGLRFMRHSNTSWQIDEPSDWNLWRRMQKVGVRIGFCDHLTYVHYLGAVRRAALQTSDR